MPPRSAHAQLATYQQRASGSAGANRITVTLNIGMLPPGYAAPGVPHAPVRDTRWHKAQGSAQHHDSWRTAFIPPERRAGERGEQEAMVQQEWHAHGAKTRLVASEWPPRVTAHSHI